MDIMKVIRRLQQIQVKLEGARHVLQDGKEIPCDRKLLGLQQMVAQLITDIANASASLSDEIVDDDEAESAQSASSDD